MEISAGNKVLDSKENYDTANPSKKCRYRLRNSSCFTRLNQSRHLTTTGNQEPGPITYLEREPAESKRASFYRKSDIPPLLLLSTRSGFVPPTQHTTLTGNKERRPSNCFGSELLAPSLRRHRGVLSRRPKIEISENPNFQEFRI